MTWIARLMRRDELERQLDAELQDHLERLEASYRERGLSPTEARRAARLEFGVDPVREECRDVRGLTWLEDAVRDTRSALRGFRAAPAFALVCVLTLALGIGANATIFSLLDAVLLKPLPVPAAGELVTLYEQGPEGAADPSGGTGRFLRFSYPRFERLARAIDGRGRLAAVTRAYRFAVTTPGDNARRFVQGQLVSSSFFDVLGIHAARGRVFTNDDVSSAPEAPSVVISDAFWRTALGSRPDVIGQSIEVNGLQATIAGVTPPGFSGVWTDAEAGMWLPLTLQQPLRYRNNSSSYGRVDNDKSWLNQDVVSWLNIVGRIPAAERRQAVATLAAANAAGLADLAAGFERETSRSSMRAHTLVVEPFGRGFSGLRARFSDALLALFAMVALVLLITCANIVNLLLARATARQRDGGIRRALGATTGRLIRQDLTESLLLTSLGGAAGALLAIWSTRWLAGQALANRTLPHVFAPDLRMLGFSIAVSLMAAVLIGVVPALRTSRAARHHSLVSAQRDQTSGESLRGMRGIVVGQLALSVLVVVSAMLLTETLINLTRLEPGFSTEQVVSVGFDPITSGYTAGQIAGLGDRLLAAASALPGVRSAAVSRCGLVAGCTSSSEVYADGATEGATAYQNWTTPGYFATNGIRLIAGRDFDERDTAAGARVAIVSESVAERFFRGQSAVGHRIGLSRPDTEIVGIVRDVRSLSVHEPPTAMVYFPVAQKPVDSQAPLTNLDLRYSGTVPPLATVQDALRRAEPQLLIDSVSTPRARLARDVSRERLAAYLASAFAGLVLLLTGLGLYGVLSYSVARRVPEIGVRMALGATAGRVRGLIVRQGAMMTVAGIAVGIAIAAGVVRYLQALLFGVAPLDPAAFLLALSQFAAVAAIACYLPARRATRVDPLVALRQE